MIKIKIDIQFIINGCEMVWVEIESIEPIKFANSQ